MREIISYALLAYWFNTGSEIAVVPSDDERLGLGCEAFIRPLRPSPDRTGIYAPVP